MPGVDLAEKQKVVKYKASDVLKSNNIPVEKIKKIYGVAIAGFHAELSSKEVIELKKDNNVAYIEENLLYYLKQSGSSPQINHHRPNHPDKGNNEPEADN
ncbi:MAG: protease inhibitor I9 family protein [Bacteroidetes bacterium]|nr:protease inhibitor I9 family protein [Bacteroidota bacterium]